MTKTNIEEKMKLFSKIIYEKIQKENEDQIKEFKSKKEDVLKKKRLELKEKEEEVIKAIEKKTNIKYSEIVSKEKMNSKQDILKAKEEFIERATKKLEEKLRDFCANGEYKKYLLNSLKKTLDSIEGGSYNIQMLPRDIEKYQKDLICEFKKHKNIKINIKSHNKDIIGGFLIKDADNRFRIDNTLISKIYDNRQDIGLKVIDIME